MQLKIGHFKFLDILVYSDSAGSQPTIVGIRAKPKGYMYLTDEPGQSMSCIRPGCRHDTWTSSVSQLNLFWLKRCAS